jgi:pimeloyl-ACP methyl ester carboxylesterase
MRLVLLPGLDGTGLLFARFVSALGPEVEVAVVHYPNDRALTYPEHEGIARSFLPTNQPYVLLGESFSGPIAISIAATQPAGLLGLILCCTFARSPYPLLSHLQPLFNFVPFNLMPKVLQSHFIFGRFSSRSLRVEHRAAVSLASNVALRARIRDVFAVDVTAKLAEINVPTLYLQASEDHVVPKSAAGPIRRGIPGAKFIELEAPHLLLQTKPDKAAGLITDFAQSIPNR